MAKLPPRRVPPRRVPRGTPPVVAAPPEDPEVVRTAQSAARLRTFDTGGAPVELARALPAAAPAEDPASAPKSEADHAEEQRKADLHKTAIDKFHLVAEALSEQRARELDDLNFEIDQWPKEYREERKGGVGPDGRNVPARPCLEINKLDQPIEQVLSEARQNELGLVVKPRGHGASKEMAYVRQGLIRAIQADSRAHIARHWALDRASKCGVGVYKIEKRYANDGDNDLDLVVSRVLNQHSVYLDPFAVEPDWSDGMFAFITADIPEAEYKRRWPKSQLAQADTDRLKAIGDAAPSWISQTKEGKAYRIAEHYYILEKERVRVYVTAGTPGWQWQDEVSDSDRRFIEPGSARTVPVRQVKWCALNAAEIMDEEDWEGRYIPLVPVIGKEYNVNGKRYWKGIISNAKDAQRSYNVMRSRQLEAIGLASLSTWVMAEGQDEGYEDQWDRANTSAFTRLMYKPTTFEGHLTEAPHRDVAEPAIMAITQGVREADGDIKATTGRFDPSLGRPGAERSGRAINALKLQGEVGTSRYLDNLATIAMAHEGRILNDLLEHVYDRPGRVARIVGDEDEEFDVMLNQPYAEEGDGEDKTPVALGFGPGDPRFNADEHKFYNLKDGGQYRVTVTIGPSAPTQQEADKQFMADVAQAAPALVPIFADLWIRASGSKVADQIADRLKRNNPYAKGDDEQKKTKIPPEIQMQVEKMQADLQQAAQIITGLQKQIADEAAKAKGAFITAQAKIASEERIKRWEVQRDLMIEKAKIDAARGEQVLDAAIATFAQTRDQAHDQEMQREMALLTAVLQPPPSTTAQAEA